MILGQQLVRIDLRYGEGTLPVEIPHRYDTESVVPKTILGLSDISDKMNRSVEYALNSSPLSQLMTQARTAAVVVNSEHDITLNRSLLKVLLGILRTSMTTPSDIMLLFSPKLGSTPNHSEIDDMLGHPTADGHRLVLHDAEDDENLCYVGDTSTYSTPVSINRAFAEADIRIGLGTIRQNVFVGATGGRISVIPHVSGYKTIVRNSKLQATCQVGPFAINSATCVDMDEISQIAGLDFIINAVPDRTDSIADIVVGEPHNAWSHGVDIARTLSETPILHKSDIAIVSAGGMSFDNTLYDAIDSLHAAREVTEYGGTIVLVAECTEGPGPSGFLRGVSECQSESEIAVFAETSYELGMEKARFLWSVLSSRKLIICSRLRESMVVEHLHSLAVRDPQEGLELAIEQMVSSPRVAVIPQGNWTLPVIKNR
ncbi:MAG: lactate racemase domain-containing protein [Candidatus Odinarchaeota archaeon]